MPVSKGKIVSAVVGYGAISWGLIQVASTVVPAFELPSYILTWLIVFVAATFPFYLVLVWRRPGFLSILSFTETAVRHEVSTASDGINRILISKFRILREAPSTDFLSVSLPEAIANALIGIRGLSIQLDMGGLIGTYHDRELSEFSANRKLNAILTGSILSVENQVRIVTSLIEQPSNQVIWTESMESPVGDLFELQDIISNRIIKSLELKLTDEEKQALEKKNTKNSEAYELFLKANELSLHAGQWESAKEIYELCLEKDPSFSLAMARLARCYRVIGKFTVSDHESVRALAFAEAYFLQAIRLDPQSDVAIGLYGQLLVDQGKLTEALELLLTRIEKSNSNANLYASLVHVLRFCALNAESIEMDRIARLIDPAILTSIGHTYFMIGNYDRAKDFTLGDIGYLEAVSLACLGRIPEAIEKLEQNESKLTNDRLKAYLQSLRYALLNDKSQSIAYLERAFTLGMDGEGLYYLTRTYAYLDEPETAIKNLSLVVDKGFYQHAAFENDPWLGGIRNHEQYADLIKRSKNASAKALEIFGRHGVSMPMLTRDKVPA